MLSHSVVSDWDLSPAKTHGAWFYDLMKLRLLMSHCKKFSERHSSRWEVDLFGFRETHTPQGVGLCRGQVQRPWNVVWLVFSSWVISYANEWDDHSNSCGTTHSSVFWQCLGTVLVPLGVSFSLQTEDQGLLEFDLSSLIHFILISLCYALGLCHFFKSCTLSPSLLFHALFLSPVQAYNVASTIFWRDNQKTAGLWERNAV